MADKKLNIKVRTQGAGKAKKDLKGVEGGMARMGKAAAKAGALFFAAKGLISGFSTIIELAGRQEQAEKKLATALGHTSKSLLAQASAFQKVSKHGDEALIEMMALASNMGIAEDRIAETTKMAIGLSEALGVDMNMAMKAAAGAIQGDTNMLTRYIPELKTTFDLTEKLGIVQRVANAGFEQSKASIDTMTGSMTQAKMAMGDTAEVVGKTLAPAIISASKMITAFFQGAGDVVHNFRIAFSDSTPEQIKFFRIMERGAHEALPILQERMSQAGLSTEDLNKSIGTIKLTLESMNKAIKETPEGAPLLDPLIGQFQLLLAAAEAMQKTGGGKGVASEFEAASKAMAGIAMSGESFSGALTGILQKQILITAQMKLQKLFQAAIGSIVPGGGFVASGLNFLFGASPTQVAPSAGAASGSKIVINNNISGFGTIDSNFASNSLIPAINKAISTGQARLG